ncbi:MAG: hypothetical protein R6V14_06650 [Halanaerobiales bacterium]
MKLGISMPSSSREHFLYEMRAHKKISKFKNFFKDKNNIDDIKLEGSENLIEYLLYNHNNYIKKWQRQESDFIYTLKIAPVLINNIVVHNNYIAEVS